MVNSKGRLYFAASLFNLGDKFFNASLAESLSQWFDVVLPQKEGFEFSKLHEVLKGKVDENEVEDVVNHLIYYLDVGYLLPGCDVCLARLDEPSDEGVISEMGHAKNGGIPVIGYRTDCRSPYGSSYNEVCGAHFFPAYDCDAFINFSSGKNSGVQEGRGELRNLAKLVYNVSEEFLRSGNRVDWRSGVCYVGKTLFGGVGDLHSDEGLGEVVRRYFSLKESFGSLSPAEIINA